MKNAHRAAWIAVCALLMLAVLVRWQFIFSFISDGDDAVFALMARHISQAREFPLYVWQAHYSGTLSLYLVAALFRFAGPHAWAYNVTGVFLSLCWAVLTLLLARRWLGRSGYCAAFALTAVAPLQVLTRSLILCGWAETLLLGTVMCIVLSRWMQQPAQRHSGSYALLGLICGIGQWISPGYTFLTLTALTVVIFTDRRRFVRQGGIWFILGALAGYLPALVYALQHPGASAMRMAGRILDLDRSVLAAAHPGLTVLRQLVWRLSTVPASLLRIPSLIRQLMGPINAAVFGVALTALCLKEVPLFLKERKITAGMVVIIAAVWFVLVYVFLVGEAAARYMHPSYMIFALCAGWAISVLWQRWKAVSLFLLLLLITANMYSIAYPSRTVDASAWKELVAWLESRGFDRGYSDYWAGYPVVFASREKVIISPTLFHPDNSDRYPDYTRQVRSAQAVFLLVDTRLYPRAKQQIEERLQALKIAFGFFQIRRFALFYDFSQPVTPQLLQLKGR
ncbi:MAG TPA: hypothetical protein P5110_03185 [Candidatus Omnitrophota bacterium]|nr:hypothetical protein [Candidatus Omnitrophota bacterium]HRZ14493.1 hypothetical protein [Candidatus Omnitrophota bacterium]